MGCCISTPNNTFSKNLKCPKTTPRNSRNSKSPPPAHPVMEEEETVKEVLSETPTVLKRPTGRAQLGNRQSESPFIKNAPLLSRNAGKDHRNGAVCRKPHIVLAGAGASEDAGSEICSTLGECESVCTNQTEKSEGKGGESREQLRKMSPARRRNASFTGDAKREKNVGRSPGRRSEPSPGRARPGNGSGRKRDCGESSGRRSRSPVIRRDSGEAKALPGRSHSARKTGKSPSRVGSGLGERVRKLDEGRNDSGDRRWPPARDESHENPLVSLECFIFL